jgi:phosphoglycerol transferase MdoB-like AlkP superfamily enzyme
LLENLFVYEVFQVNKVSVLEHPEYGNFPGGTLKPSPDKPEKSLIRRVLYSCYCFFVLLVTGTGLGLASLYFGTANYVMPMFLSYFKVKYLVLLNIFPVVFCIFLFYFLFNRIWISFLLTSIITMVLTWVNYFKLLLRDDPFLASDFTLISEALDMSGQYQVHPNREIIYVIIACILLTAAAFFVAKGKIRSIRLRLVGLIVMIAVGFLAYNQIYMSDVLYKSIENNALINQWSGTQVYISKGFIYPFIYSIKTSIPKPPEGYNEKTAKDRLYSYTYSDIPDSRKVNVISVMFEAYNDFSKFPQLEFNTDVYEYLHQLEKESYSGELVTNIFSGGTINTERSFLTGYTDVPDFRSDVNSYARYFREQGYAVEGSHPCYGWFYNRKNINEYLGFQHYYFLENYYSELTDGKMGRDNILFQEITKLFEANKKTGKPYFSFNVTYQNHGPYVSKTIPKDFVKNKGYNQKDYKLLNTYLTGINNTTRGLKTLIDYFRKENSPVVVILFGDHNPGLGSNCSVYKTLGINLDLDTEEGFYNYYSTPYVIWANESARKALGNSFTGKGPRMGPCFLMDEFFQLAGYGGNEYMKLSSDLKADVKVVHAKNRYTESGHLTSKLSDRSQQKLNDFLRAQYYWMRNFREKPNKEDRD